MELLTVSGKISSDDFDSSSCAALFGGCGRYQYSRRETLLAIRAYAQSEPRSAKTEAGSGR